MSESHSNSETYKTRYELKEDLVKVALKCDADVEKFIDIFSDFLGIKNVTLSALEHNYCFAKYAADNELLPLENIELNPNRISTINIDCGGIIKEERERFEKELVKTINASPSEIKCISEEYRNKNIFDAQISSLVLTYLDFPKEIKEAATAKLKDKLTQIFWIGFLCAAAGGT